MKRHMTAGLGLIAGLALGLVPAGLATPGAAGANADRATPATSVSRHAAATTRGEQKRIEDYWTPDRMKNAVPVGKKVTKGKPGGGTSGGTAVLETTVQPKFGKVFFTEGRTNYVCSGTATTSNNHDVVTTAGHCVNEGPGAYVTNFMFAPAYNNGVSPQYGTWTANSLLTTTQWATAGDFNFDVGFAVMNTNAAGQSLTDVTGSYAPVWNPARGQVMKANGYPAAKPFNGQQLYSCTGTVTQDTFGGSTDQGLACNMTGGSSGGGWIQGGSLASVTSFGYTGLKNVLFGPYFGDVIKATYLAAAG